MSKPHTVSSAAMAAIVLALVTAWIAPPCQATTIGFHGLEAFNCDESQGIVDANQLTVDIAFDGTSVSFTFNNGIGAPPENEAWTNAVISEIYFYDGDTSGPRLSFAEVIFPIEYAGVEFEEGANPASPPQWDPFFAIQAAGNTATGIGVGESLTVNPVSWNGDDALSDAFIRAAFAVDGSLAIALHVRAIGACDESDWFVTPGIVEPPVPPVPNPVVPEPTTLTLLGVGLAGLAARRGSWRRGA